MRDTVRKVAILNFKFSKLGESLGYLVLLTSKLTVLFTTRQPADGLKSILCSRQRAPDIAS